MNHYYGRKRAFTLAEVLITLGIIGVVAAMTIPTLISNHKKKVIETRLKVAQSTISQMLNFAIAEYGDPNTWEFSQVYGSDVSDQNRKKLIIDLTEKYFLPYLKDVNRSGYMSMSKAGYDVYHAPDGSINSNNLNFLSKEHYVIEFANGMTIFVYMNSSTANGGISTNILLYIDVNGKHPPNVFGKDTFVAEIISSTGKFTWLGSTDSRDELKEKCKNGMVCGALIQQDGWQIKKDYPVKI